MAPEISRRVASILDAVESEAARLRDDARIEAARYSETPAAGPTASSRSADAASPS